MKRLFIFCMLVVSFSRVHAVIVTADFIKGTIPELAAKKIILYGDHHIRAAEDLPQLNALTESLIKRDRESPEQTHILIEQPPGVPADYSVISNLAHALTDCTHTVVKNVEMRCFTGAAWHLLNPDKDPSMLCPDAFYDSGYARCVVGDTTFGDVDDEISYFKQKIDTWGSTINPLYASALRSLEPEFQAHFTRYKAICAALKIARNTNVRELSMKLYGETPNFRTALYKLIHDLASSTFDMHLFKTIMSLKDPDNIVLVAGERHTGQVFGLLDQCGNQDYSRYPKIWRTDLKPVPTRYLFIDAGYGFPCLPCSIQ